MKWYEWESLEQFDLWHNNLCAELGYPETPVNQLTGLPDETAAKTEIYCSAILVDDRYIAQVEEQYAEGLVETSLRPILVEPPLA